MVTGQGEAEREERKWDSRRRNRREKSYNEGKRKCEIQKHVIGRREQGMADKK
jgi:hypothetical protein